ncbi:unnamed protein product [Cuscuta europaea]|uniref:Glutaredoxin domain-containing protein n=1 Tax=Cuscuta europaea TaxID=41803 RepID=A0A9P1DYB6_CUSEU|nr:unnamed protein product [Cuscuta europaea]
MPSMNNFGATLSDGSAHSTTGGDSDYAVLVSENAIVLFGRSGCCMRYVVQSLLIGLGVNPTIYDVEEEKEVAVIQQLSRIISCTEDQAPQLPPFPAVFIGGKFFGGLDKVMESHISGDLVPLLRKAGALWV